MANFTLGDLFDTLHLSEDKGIEFKRAAGKDGAGQLPESALATYSAMANSYGGEIVLGVAEHENTFDVTGVDKPDKVIKEWWDALNNKQRVSVNLLTDNDLKVERIGGKRIIVISIPRANRLQRPVFLGLNPLRGTYRRNHEGDYLCDEETVKRMLAEQVEPERDGKLLHGYTMQDLNQETFRAYRQQFANRQPSHPWTALQDLEFLRSVGGWMQDRVSGDEGLTLAGLLMFGKLQSIQEAVPNYMLDYQERPEPKTSLRWSDRLITDGSWSGNLFDFYRLVITKLYRDLKVPFQLSGDQRKEETPVHEALREALVNTLIHADYSERVSVLVVKRPDLFGFRNPGSMRVSIEDAIRGGHSDCRNRRLQKMFLLVGLAEQAGSGIPKIWVNWRGQHWRAPNLSEQSNPDETLLWLRMLDLFPESAMKELTDRFGDSWKGLTEIQITALATVATDGTITHSRLKSMLVDHSSDISKALHNLVRDGYLQSSGAARGTFYSFVGDVADTDDGKLDEQALLKLFSSPSPDDLSSPSSEQIRSSFEQITPSSEQITPSSEQITFSSEQMRSKTQQMDRLRKLANPARQKTKIPQATMRSIITEMCDGQFVTLGQLSEALGREKDTLRVHYLNPMVKAGQLVKQYPNHPSHPGQAYRSVSQAKPSMPRT